MQLSVYSGHKRINCLIYQTLSTSEGLIFSLHGLVQVRRHNLTFFHQRGWEDVMAESFSENGRQFYIYGDSTYLLRK